MGIIVDAHSDILLNIHPRRIMGEKQVLEKYWVPKMKQGQIDVRVASIYIENQYVPEGSLRRALDLVDTLYEEIDESPSSVLCTTFDDIRKAKEKGKIAFILGLEGAEPLGADIQLLRIFYTLGLRVLTLTHVLRNYIADGAFYSPREIGQVGGLTDVGVKFLEQAQAIGIIIDVTHLNEPSFWDVMKLTKAPVIASHSACKVLFNIARNITDDQIKAVANQGGVVAVPACKFFFKKGDLEDVLGHIDHMVKVGGIEHVGLGLDPADYALPYLAPIERVRLPLDGFPYVDGLVGDEDIPKIADGLTKRRYRACDIDLIMGENLMRVFKDVLR
jgi:membrane dipeptidase